MLTRAARAELHAPGVHTLYCPVCKSAATMLSRWGWRGVDGLVAISSNVAASVRALGIEPRTAVIPPAVNTAAFTPERDGLAFRRRHGLGTDQPLLLFVGSLHPAKGLELLLQAFAEVVHRLAAARLVITLEFAPLGSPHVGGRIARLIKTLGIADRIIQLGFVHDMPELMAAADALIIPFRSTRGPSDYPLPLLEAMSAGTPVIAAPVGAVPELIEHGINGWLASPQDVQGLADAIVNALRLRGGDKALTAAARATVVERFGIAAVAAQTEAFFRQVLGGRS